MGRFSRLRREQPSRRVHVSLDQPDGDSAQASMAWQRAAWPGAKVLLTYNEVIAYGTVQEDQPPDLGKNHRSVVLFTRADPEGIQTVLPVDRFTCFLTEAAYRQAAQAQWPPEEVYAGMLTTLYFKGGLA